MAVEYRHLYIYKGTAMGDAKRARGWRRDGDLFAVRETDESGSQTHDLLAVEGREFDSSYPLPECYQAFVGFLNRRAAEGWRVAGYCASTTGSASWPLGHFLLVRES